MGDGDCVLGTGAGATCRVTRMTAEEIRGVQIVCNQKTEHNKPRLQGHMIRYERTTIF